MVLGAGRVLTHLESRAALLGCGKARLSAVCANQHAQIKFTCPWPVGTWPSAPALMSVEWPAFVHRTRVRLAPADFALAGRRAAATAGLFWCFPLSTRGALAVAIHSGTSPGPGVAGNRAMLATDPP